MSASEQEKNTEAVAMKEYRTRKITLEPFDSDDNLLVNFDNFALMCDGKFYSKLIRVVSGQCDPPFILNEYSEQWEVEVKMTLRLADNTKTPFECVSSMSKQNPSVRQNFNHDHNTSLVIDLEFVKLDGLNVEPLRNYAVANKYSDVTIIVEGQKFELNKTFLASHSSYFETLFFGDFDEKNQREIELKDVSADAFTDLLDILTLSMHQLHRKDAIFAVLKLADQQDIPLVFKRIENMLLMYPRLRALNIAEKLWAADKYGMKMVLMHVMSTWTTDDSEKYITPELWNDLKPATTLQLFKTLGMKTQ